MRAHFPSALAFTLLVSAAAGAQSEPAAATVSAQSDPFDAAYETANALAADGKWPEAAKHFAQAASLRPTAVTVFNWAQAERNAGNAGVAKAQFTRAKDLAKREGAEEVQRLSEQALGELQDQIGRIALVLPPGKRVSVSIDGDPVTPSNGQLDVKPGEHRLVVTSPGEPTFVRVVRVRPGQATGVSVHFRGVGSDVPKDAATNAGPAPRGSGPPTLSVVLGGVGAAALTGGLVFHLHRNNKLEQAASECTRKGDAWACPAGVQADPRHQDARDAADSALLIRNVLFGVGGAAIASGVAIWIATPSKEKVQLGAVPLPGGAAGSARFRF